MTSYRFHHADRSVAVEIAGPGLACCGLEYAVAVEDAEASEDPADLRVFVVAGTVTEAMADELASSYAELPGPKAVLSFGACSASGGPYWDSYAVRPGLAGLIPVDMYVPGCPPRPEALAAAIVELVSR